jgi:CheY-like chemotaxis protein
MRVAPTISAYSYFECFWLSITLHNRVKRLSQSPKIEKRGYLMQTHTAYVLWLNLCADARNTQDLTVFDTLDTLFTIKPVDSHQITTFVSTKCPQIICLEYDFPDRHGLLLLRQLRFDYPSIPIIMLTTKSCESLAIWAFRTGVRDYLVKPLPASSMVGTFNSIASLLISSTLQNPHTPRRNILPPPPYTTRISSWKARCTN